MAAEPDKAPPANKAMITPATAPPADPQKKAVASKAAISPAIAPWSTRLRHVGTFAQCLVFSGAILFMYGHWAYFHPVYLNVLTVTMKKWVGARAEMARPVYFILLTSLPLLVMVLAWEFLRNFNVRRITSQRVMDLSVVLRRKPSLMGGRYVSTLSIGELLFALLLVFGNVFTFAYNCDTRIKRIEAAALKAKTTVTYEQYLKTVGMTFGFSAIFNVAFLFLPATRNCVWMEFLNISYANGVKYHRWIGVVTVCATIIHCALYYSAWVREGIWSQQILPCVNCDIGTKANARRLQNLFGEFSLIIFLIMSAASIPIVRRKFYNVFYYTHQLFILAVIFIALHYHATIWWMMASLIVYFVGRALSMANTTMPVKVKEVTTLSNDLVRVVFSRAPGVSGHYNIGQFLYLNVPAISKLQWHAFTIASSPYTSPTSVTVLIKSLGDWTQDLVTHANECKTKNVLPTLYVDGYYGASLELYDEYATVCLVGGGIGVTPLFAILDDMATKLTSSPSSMVLRQRVVLVFAFRELALLEEIHPVLQKLRALDPTGQFFQTHLYLTRPWTEDDTHHRIQARASVSCTATKYEDESTASTVTAFHEPLRPSWLRALTWVAAFLCGVLLPVLLLYGNGKIKRDNAKLWALQQFVEILMVIGAGGVVLALGFAERHYRRQAALQAKGADMFSVVQPTVPAGDAKPTSGDMPTRQELVDLHKVVVGKRPDLEALMTQTLDFHGKSSATVFGRNVIGTFVSGPGAMKRAVECGVARLGTAHFDIHMEEFEL